MPGAKPERLFSPNVCPKCPRLPVLRKKRYATGVGEQVCERLRGVRFRYALVHSPAQMRRKNARTGLIR
jgi:hypothetical protein